MSISRAQQYFEDKVNFTTGPIELSGMMQRRENINIIDVRAPEDYAKGHIPGAISAPKGKWDTFTSLTRDGINIIYCYSQQCHLAANAALKFAAKGFPVMELEGGFDTWQDHNLPVET